MSADNELVIAEFSDCVVVAMQFASVWWDIDPQTAKPEVIRDFFKNGKIFLRFDEAEAYADKEEQSSYYEYGSSSIKLDFPFMV